jgi:hypothetical protein
VKEDLGASAQGDAAEPERLYPKLSPAAMSRTLDALKASLQRSPSPNFNLLPEEEEPAAPEGSEPGRPL